MRTEDVPYRGAPRRRATDHVNVEKVFAGGGEMGRLIRALDWSKTPLGPIESWSEALRTMVRLLLANRFPLLLWWGPEYISIYNDPYQPILGAKHPWVLGRPLRECWPEIWHVIRPLVDTPFKGGPATWNDDLLLEINRHGFLEETHFTIAYSPVPDDTTPGGIGGVLATVYEITEKVVAERRVVTLRDLGNHIGEAKTCEQACAIAARTLATHAKDIPFALLYLIDEEATRATLAGSAGVAFDQSVSPRSVDLTQHGNDGWPLADVLRTGVSQVVPALHERFTQIPQGPWSDAPDMAVVLPIPSNRSHEPTGMLVLGVSARLKLDDFYRDFLELVRNQVATAIANARVYEEERKRAEAFAELDRAKTAFFSNVSHEFRTPLTLMLGPSEDLLGGAHGELTSAQRSQLELIHRSTLRLEKLVNALLEFSRIGAGRVRGNYQPVDLGGVTADLASTFRSAIERAGVELVVNCPPLSEPAFVDCDMWEKIVLNLLSNAFKFTFEGTIEVSLRPLSNHFELSVSDTGVGVPEPEVPRLFERFHRVEGTEGRTHEGSGIGLALVQELVRMHGGTVRAESRLGVGSKFTVTIPKGNRHLPEQLVAEPVAVPSAAPGAAPFVEEALRWVQLPAQEQTVPALRPAVVDATLPRESKRILLAEDNADLRDYVRRILGPHWVVETVEDGAEALARALAQPPDLVLTDIMMRRVDGFALLRELRSHAETRSVPVIMLSARASEEARLEGLEAGADDYLTKPFSARELLARVRTHLELARLRRGIEAERDRLHALLGQAPAIINFFRGPNLVIEFMHPKADEVLGGRAVVGRPLLEVAPELRDQEYPALLESVIQTGERIEGQEKLVRYETGGGQLRESYWDFAYLPVRNEDGEIEGVMTFNQDVTKQVLARRRLEQSEEKFRRIVTQVQAGIAETDLTGRFTLVNERYCEIVARSREELLELCVRDIIHPDDLPGHLVQFQRLREEGAAFVGEERCLQPDGSVAWVQSSVARLDDAQGQPVGAVAVAIDITQRECAARALKESEERFRNLANNAPVMVWMTEADARCTFLSESWYEFTGMTPETSLGFGWVQAIHPEDRQRAQDAFLSANAQQDGFRLEYRLRRHDGEYRWAIDSAAPRRGSGCEFLGYIGSVIDISERKAAEVSVAASEARFRSLFEIAEVSLWEEDLSAVKRRIDALQSEHGDLRVLLEARPALVDELIGLVRIRDVNPATLRMFGATHKRELLASLGTIFVPETRPVFVEELVAIGEGRRVFSSEAIVRKVTGESIHVLLTMGFHGCDAGCERVLVTLVDISEKKLAEREQQARAVEMERTVRFSEMFLGILGHDLRSPLSAIVMAASLVSRRAGDAEQLAKPASRILASADRMDRMISQLLDFTQIRLGRGLPLDRDEVALDEIARSVVEELEPAGNAHAIRISVTGNARGYWDQDRLTQLLSNLVANARQHSPQGTSVAIRIDGSDHELVRLEVHNEGVIPEDILPSIFEPLRGGSATRSRAGSSGLGLGLYITQQIVLGHGGSIRVESRPTEGTTFFVELCREPAETSRHVFSSGGEGVPPSR